MTRRSNQLNEERTRHTTAARGHEQAASAARQRVALLRTTHGHLAGDVGDTAPSADVTAFVGDDADEQVRTLRRRITSLAEQRQTAVGELQVAHHQLLRLVRSDRFASLLGDGQATSRMRP